jgi:subtilisin family serine protease
MRTLPLRDFRLLAALAVATAVAVALALAGPLAGAKRADGRGPAEAWKSAFERRAPLPSDGRMIVVLAGPSLAERLERGRLSPKVQRAFVRRTQAFQRRLLGVLRAQGVKIVPIHSYTRTFNGFSAVLSARALVALERAPGVVGVYPVRAVYPASLSAAVVGAAAVADGRAGGLSVPGADGSGVTVALLDSGVDASHPSLDGRVLPGIDLIDGDRRALPRRSPDGRLDTHGTRMAGIVAGSGGPGAVGGVAPGATILPIRVIGWQRSEVGSELSGRADTVLAGLERAVDPNRDGDVRDAVPIVLAALVEPYASFPDSPEARAVAGARALGTLVVAAAGNDGPADGGFGTVGAPAGAAAALAVGAVDTRGALPAARVSVDVDGETILSATVRALGAILPASGIELEARSTSGPTASDPSRDATAVATGNARGDFLDATGTSFVFERAAFVPADGESIARKVRNATSAGARALLVYGSGLPAGGLDLEESSSIPVVPVPVDVGRRVVAARAEGLDVSVSISPAESLPNDAAGGVAGFSSQGPAFDGSVKPDLVAPGVGIAAPDAGTGPDGTARYATVTGSSAAAAVVAGAAALVAELRPELDADTLATVLVASAEQVAPAGRPEPVTAQGAGLVDPGRAAALELVVRAGPTVSDSAGDRWSSRRVVRVENLGDHPVTLTFGFVPDEDATATLTLSARPGSLNLGPGETGDAVLGVSASERPAARVSGTIVVSSALGAARVPWIVAMAPRDTGRLLGRVEISEDLLVPSLTDPAVLTFQAGTVAAASEGIAVEPVAGLEIELRTAGGRRLGVLARLRDLLPGTYAIGLTGRGPDGQVLKPGRYVVQLRAFAVDAGEGAKKADSTRSIAFTVRPAAS